MKAFPIMISRLYGFVPFDKISTFLFIDVEWKCTAKILFRIK